jgi:hypothetical protein
MNMYNNENKKKSGCRTPKFPIEHELYHPTQLITMEKNITKGTHNLQLANPNPRYDMINVTKVDLC